MRHKSDEELAQFLSKSTSELLFSLTQTLSSWFVHTGFRGRYPAVEDIPIDINQKKLLAYEIVDELSYFGSHNFAYWGRKVFGRQPGVGYHDTLYDVSLILGKQADKIIKIPRVASVKEREETICSQLLQVAFKNKTEKEITEMLLEAGLDADVIQTKAIRSAIQSGGAGVFIAVLQIVGKKVVMQIVQAALYKLIAARLGKEAAEKVLTVLAKQVTQKAMQAFLGAIGAAFIVHDIVNMAGPASRVCLPTVALIATARVNSRLSVTGA